MAPQSSAATAEQENNSAGSSARTRPRPAAAARAAGASLEHTSSGQQPTRIQTGSDRIQPRAAAATSEAAPRFCTRTEQRQFSRQRKGTKPNVSYAASLAAILQHQLS